MTDVSWYDWVIGIVGSLATLTAGAVATMMVRMNAGMEVMKTEFKGLRATFSTDIQHVVQIVDTKLSAISDRLETLVHLDARMRKAEDNINRIATKERQYDEWRPRVDRSIADLREMIAGMNGGRQRPGGTS